MTKVFNPNEYSWQKITANAGLPLTFKFNQEFDVAKLQAETKALFEKYVAGEQQGRYHKGGWVGISLHAANGDYKETRLLEGVEYQKTEALQIAPYIESIIDSFNCDKHRIRLMTLESGKDIFWHIDDGDSLDEVTVRLHIPVITNEKVLFQISHENCNWRAGEFWYGDFSFPHRLYNGWDQDRVHLILDLVVNEKIEAMFPAEFVAQRAARKKMKKQVYRSFKRYDFPNRVKAKLKSLLAS